MGLFSKKTNVGVDIGHHSIKVMQLEKSGDSYKVSKFATAPTPKEAIRDGVVVDPALMGLVLKQLLKESHISATSALIAVAGGSVIVRPVRIPKMAEATLRRSMKLEAGRYIPSSTEDSYIEFEIVGDAEDNQMDVLMVAAPKDIVESRMQACAEAGLDTEAVDVAVFAAYRALVEADPTKDYSETTVALIDIGASTTSVSVVHKGAFVMSRTIPNGGHVLTEALTSYFKISDEDAESGKAQLDFSELMHDEKPKENPPLRVLQPHVDDLVREIRRSLNYYQSQQAEGAQANTVDALLLTGGGAKMTGLSAYLSHKLGIQLIEADVYQNPRFLHAGDEGQNGSDLSVVTGLALRPYGKAA